MALHEMQKRNYHIAALLTTITCDYDRISMHGVRRQLLERQAEALGLPLHQVLITGDASNEQYEQKMIEACGRYQPRGIDSVAFGDLFLADVRAYRDQFLARHGLKGIYPVWLRDTSEFISQFIALGFKAVITCVDREVIDSSFAGALINEKFLSSLPPHVDPCGENGEFHTFVFDGPNFKHPVKFSLGESVQRDRFCFRDLVPA